MSFTVFLGNLPAWVTSDDIKSWLTAENLVADQIKVIRNPETQESKGFAFIEAPNNDEMQSIIKRFDRAPLEDRMLRANPAQPPKGKVGGPGGPGGRPGAAMGGPGMGERSDRPPREGMRRMGGNGGGGMNGGSGGGMRRPEGAPAATTAVPAGTAAAASTATAAAPPPAERPRRERRAGGPQSAFAEELAKAL